MFELVRAQCPACGATLNVDTRRPVAQCEYCGQRSALRIRNATPSAPPPLQPGAAPMPVIEIPDVRRRIALILVLTLLPLVLVSVIVFVVIQRVTDAVPSAVGQSATPSSSSAAPSNDSPGDRDAPAVRDALDEPLAPLPTVSSYLASPGDIAERVRRGVVDPPRVRSLSIERATVEAYPPDGQRYSIHTSGRALRRGGGRDVPPHEIDLTAVDFSAVATILAAVRDQRGTEPSRIVLEAPEGTPQWQISVRTEGRSEQLRFSLDGTPVTQ